MKIAVAMASRGRPMALIGSVMALWRLRSGRHDIFFRIGVDEDDEKTHAATFDEDEFPAGVVEAVVKPRSPFRGERENDALALAKGCDVVSLMSDRTFCITPNWDDVLARAYAQAPKRILWWSCPVDGGCVVPAIPKTYLDANNWKWSPEIFPFWWDDTWHQEIDAMIHGIPSQKVVAAYAGKRGATHRGREFAFWLNVFTKTRPMRRAQAQIIASKFGLKITQRPDTEAWMANYDSAMRERCTAFEAEYGDKSDPGPEYGFAKAKAEKMLEDMK